MKFLKKKKILSSISTAVAILLLFQEASTAAPVANFSSAGISLYPKAPQGNFASLDLPAKFGKVATVHLGSPKQTVIHIQDLHINEDAQIKIAKIIDHVAARYGVRLVLIEGASGELAHGLLSRYPNPKARILAGRSFLKEGMITGPEYLAIAKNPNLILYGVEKKELYEKNRKALLRAIKLGEGLDNDLNALQKKIKSLATRIFSSGVRSWLERQELFENNKQSISNYVHYLKELCTKEELRCETPQMIRLMKLEELEKRAHKEKRFENEKELSGYIETILKLEGGLDAGIFDEIKQIEKILKDRLIKSDDETLLYRLFQVFQVYEKMFALSLTREDTEFLYKNRIDFDPARIRAAITGLAKRHPLEIDTRSISFGKLEEALRAYEEFYGLALARDETLISQSIASMKHYGENTVILVTGGFHTPAIERRLKKEGFSFCTITPFIKEIDFQKDQKLYFKAMQMPKSPIAPFAGAPDPSLQLQIASNIPTQSEFRDVNPRFTTMMTELAAIGLRLGERDLKNAFTHLSQSENRLAAIYRQFQQPGTLVHRFDSKTGKAFVPYLKETGFGLNLRWKPAPPVRSENRRLKRLSFETPDGVLTNIEVLTDPALSNVFRKEFERVPQKKGRPSVRKRSDVKPSEIRTQTAEPTLHFAGPTSSQVESAKKLEPQKEEAASGKFNLKILGVVGGALLFISAVFPVSLGTIFASLMLYRAGLALKKLMNEWGHVAVGSLIYRGTFTLQNLMGNRSLGDWLKEAFLFQHVESVAFVHIPEIEKYEQLEQHIQALKELKEITPGQRKDLLESEKKLKTLEHWDNAVRQGGWFAGVGFAAMFTTGIFSWLVYSGLFSAPLFASFLLGMTTTGMIAYVSDFISSNVPGIYNCGILWMNVKRRPGESNEEHMKRMQGVFKRLLLFMILFGSHGIGAAVEVQYPDGRLDYIHFKIPNGYGQNPFFFKRMGRIDFVHQFLELFWDKVEEEMRKGARLTGKIRGHARLKTSGGKLQIDTTQPFKLEAGSKIAYSAANGDTQKALLPAFTSKMKFRGRTGTYYSANSSNSQWGEFYSRAYNAKIGDNDSEEAAYFMYFLTTQGLVVDSLRLAFVSVFFKSLEDPLPSIGQFQNWEKTLDALIKKYGAQDWTQPAVMKKLVNEAVSLLPKNQVFPEASNSDYRNFLTAAFTAFKENDSYRAARIFMSMVNGHSTYGLFYESLLDPNKLVVISRTQPVSIVENVDKGIQLGGSNLDFIKWSIRQGDNQYKPGDRLRTLTLRPEKEQPEKGGEIAEINNETGEVKIYSMIEGRELSRDEIYGNEEKGIKGRWVDITNEPPEWIPPQLHSYPMLNDLYAALPVSLELHAEQKTSTPEQSATLRAQKKFSARWAANARSIEEIHQKLHQDNLETPVFHRAPDLLIVVFREEGIAIGNWFKDLMKATFGMAHIKVVNANDYIRDFENEVYKNTSTFFLRADFPMIRVAEEHKRRVKQDKGEVKDLAANQPRDLDETEATWKVLEILHDRKPPHAFVFTLTSENNVSRALDKDHVNIISTKYFPEVDGSAGAQWSQIVALLELYMQLLKDMRREFPRGAPLGMIFSKKDIESFDANFEHMLFEGLTDLIGINFDEKGRIIQAETQVHKNLVRFADQFRPYFTEQVRATAISTTHLLGAVGLTGSIMHIIAAILLSGFGPVWGLPAIFLSFASHLFDVPLFLFFKYGALRYLRWNEGREGLNRDQNPAIVIGDDMLGDLIRNNLSKMFGLAKGIVSPSAIYSAKQLSELEGKHGHDVVRGTFIIYVVPAEMPWNNYVNAGHDGVSLVKDQAESFASIESVGPTSVGFVDHPDLAKFKFRHAVSMYSKKRAQLQREENFDNPREAGKILNFFNAPLYMIAQQVTLVEMVRGMQKLKVGYPIQWPPEDNLNSRDATTMAPIYAGSPVWESGEEWVFLRRRSLSEAFPLSINGRTDEDPLLGDLKEINGWHPSVKGWSVARQLRLNFSENGQGHVDDIEEATARSELRGGEKLTAASKIKNKILEKLEAFEAEQAFKALKAEQKNALLDFLENYFLDQYNKSTSLPLEDLDVWEGDLRQRNNKYKSSSVLYDLNVLQFLSAQIENGLLKDEIKISELPKWVIETLGDPSDNILFNNIDYAIEQAKSLDELTKIRDTIHGLPEPISEMEPFHKILPKLNGHLAELDGVLAQIDQIPDVSSMREATHQILMNNGDIPEALQALGEQAERIQEAVSKLETLEIELVGMRSELREKIKTVDEALRLVRGKIKELKDAHKEVEQTYHILKLRQRAQKLTQGTTRLLQLARVLTPHRLADFERRLNDFQYDLINWRFDVEESLAALFDLPHEIRAALEKEFKEQENQFAQVIVEILPALSTSGIAGATAEWNRKIQELKQSTSKSEPPFSEEPVAESMQETLLNKRSQELEAARLREQELTKALNVAALREKDLANHFDEETDKAREADQASVAREQNLQEQIGDLQQKLETAVKNANEAKQLSGELARVTGDYAQAIAASRLREEEWESRLGKAITLARNTVKAATEREGTLQTKVSDLKLQLASVGDNAQKAAELQQELERVTHEHAQALQAASLREKDLSRQLEAAQLREEEWGARLTEAISLAKKTAKTGAERKETLQDKVGEPKERGWFRSTTTPTSPKTPRRQFGVEALGERITPSAMDPLQVTTQLGEAFHNSSEQNIASVQPEPLVPLSNTNTMTMDVKSSDPSVTSSVLDEVFLNTDFGETEFVSSFVKEPFASDVMETVNLDQNGHVTQIDIAYSLSFGEKSISLEATLSDFQYADGKPKGFSFTEMQNGSISPKREGRFEDRDGQLIGIVESASDFKFEFAFNYPERVAGSPVGVVSQAIITTQDGAKVTVDFQISYKKAEAGGEYEQPEVKEFDNTPAQLPDSSAGPSGGESSVFLDARSFAFTDEFMGGGEGDGEELGTSPDELLAVLKELDASDKKVNPLPAEEPVDSAEGEKQKKDTSEIPNLKVARRPPAVFSQPLDEASPLIKARGQLSPLPAAEKLNRLDIGAVLLTVIGFATGGFLLNRNNKDETRSEARNLELALQISALFFYWGGLSMSKMILRRLFSISPRKSDNDLKTWINRVFILTFMSAIGYIPIWFEIPISLLAALVWIFYVAAFVGRSFLPTVLLWIATVISFPLQLIISSVASLFSLKKNVTAILGISTLLSAGYIGTRANTFLSNLNLLNRNRNQRLENVIAPFFSNSKQSVPKETTVTPGVENEDETPTPKETVSFKFQNVIPLLDDSVSLLAPNEGHLEMDPRTKVFDSEADVMELKRQIEASEENSSKRQQLETKLMQLYERLWQSPRKAFKVKGGEPLLLLKRVTDTKASVLKRLAEALRKMDRHYAEKGLYSKDLTQTKDRLFNNFAYLAREIANYSDLQSMEISKILAPFEEGEEGWFIPSQRPLGTVTAGTVLGMAHSSHRLSVKISVPVHTWKDYDLLRAPLWVTLRGKEQKTRMEREIIDQRLEDGKLILELGLESDPPTRHKIFDWDEKNSRPYPVNIRFEPPLRKNPVSYRDRLEKIHPFSLYQTASYTVVGKRALQAIHPTGMGRVSFNAGENEWVESQRPVVGVRPKDRERLETLVAKTKEFRRDMGEYLEQLKKLVDRKIIPISLTEVTKFSEDISQIESLLSQLKFLDSKAPITGMLMGTFDAEGQAVQGRALGWVVPRQVEITDALSKDISIHIGDAVIVRRMPTGQEIPGIVRKIYPELPQNVRERIMGANDDPSKYKAILVEVSNEPFNWLAKNEYDIKIFPTKTPEVQKWLKKEYEDYEKKLDRMYRGQNLASLERIPEVEFLSPSPSEIMTWNRELKNPAPRMDPMPSESQFRDLSPVLAREQKGEADVDAIKSKNEDVLRIIRTSNGAQRRQAMEDFIHHAKSPANVKIREIKEIILHGPADVAQLGLAYLFWHQLIIDLIEVHKMLYHKSPDLDMTKLARAHVIELLETHEDSLNRLVQLRNIDSEEAKVYPEKERIARIVQEFIIAILAADNAAFENFEIVVRDILSSEFWPTRADKMALAHALEKTTGNHPLYERLIKAAFLIRNYIFAETALHISFSHGEPQSHAEGVGAVARYDTGTWDDLHSTKKSDYEDLRRLKDLRWIVNYERPEENFKGKIDDIRYGLALQKYQELDRDIEFPEPPKVLDFSPRSGGIRTDHLFRQYSYEGKQKDFFEEDRKPFPPSPHELDRFVQMSELPWNQSFIPWRTRPVEELVMNPSPEALSVLARRIVDTKSPEVISLLLAQNVDGKLIEEMSRLQNSSHSKPGTMIRFHQALGRLSGPKIFGLTKGARDRALRTLLESFTDYESKDLDQARHGIEKTLEEAGVLEFSGERNAVRQATLWAIEVTIEWIRGVPLFSYVYTPAEVELRDIEKALHIKNFDPRRVQAAWVRLAQHDPTVFNRLLDLTEFRRGQIERGSARDHQTHLETHRLATAVWMVVLGFVVGISSRITAFAVSQRSSSESKKKDGFFPSRPLKSYEALKTFMKSRNRPRSELRLMAALDGKTKFQRQMRLNHELGLQTKLDKATLIVAMPDAAFDAGLFALLNEGDMPFHAGVVTDRFSALAPDGIKTFTDGRILVSGQTFDETLQQLIEGARKRGTSASEIIIYAGDEDSRFTAAVMKRQLANHKNITFEVRRITRDAVDRIAKNSSLSFSRIEALRAQARALASAA